MQERNDRSVPKTPWGTAESVQATGAGKQTVDGISQLAPSRRTVVKGAAWSVPVIGLAFATPSAAATGVTQTYTFTTEGTGTSGSSCTFTLPATAKNITYDVAGAGGGSSWSNVGGEGSRLTGSLTAPGADVSVQIVAGGHGGNSFDSGGLPSAGTAVGATPGTGWGNGGAGGAGVVPVPATSHNIPEYGGAGGAGSALVIAGTALVVAGGGGGAGAQGSGYYANAAMASLIANAGKGGAAPSGAGANGDGEWIDVGGSPVISVLTVGGGGGSTTGGAAGTTTLSGSPSAQFNIDGLPGTAGTPTAPGVGAEGRGIGVRANVVVGERTYFAAGGGGGGGYSGGGSGGARAFTYNSLVAHSCAGSGGSGSDYVTPTPVSGVSVVGATPGVGGTTSFRGAQPGSVTVTFTAPAGLNLGGC